MTFISVNVSPSTNSARSTTTFIELSGEMNPLKLEYNLENLVNKYFFWKLSNFIKIDLIVQKFIMPIMYSIVLTGRTQTSPEQHVLGNEDSGYVIYNEHRNCG